MEHKARGAVIANPRSLTPTVCPSSLQSHQKGTKLSSACQFEVHAFTVNLYLSLWAGYSWIECKKDDYSTTDT